MLYKGTCNKFGHNFSTRIAPILTQCNENLPSCKPEWPVGRIQIFSISLGIDLIPNSSQAASF